MKSFIFITIFSISNIWADDQACTPEKVRTEIIEYLNGINHYQGDEGHIKLDNIKIGTVLSYPDFENTTFYYVTVMARMEILSKDAPLKQENGILVFWYNASTCENTNLVFDDLKPIKLEE